MITIVLAIVVLGVLGAIFGLILAIAAKAFHVEKDPREEAIAECLPGANCGGCGFPGCSGYAAAVVKGEASITACAAGGADVANKIGDIMGLSAGAAVRTIAAIKCSGATGIVREKFEYVGLQDCVSATLVGGGGPNACAFGCIGLGTCVKACPFGAMSIENGLAKVDRELCVGCMKCAEVCPKHLIINIPYKSKVTIPCNSTEKGALLRKQCDVGCIGCKLCEKECPFDAIKIENNIAVIDHSKCVSCGKCVAKCPRKIIKDIRPPRVPKPAPAPKVETPSDTTPAT